MRPSLGLAALALAIALPAQAENISSAADWDAPAAADRPTMQALHADIAACRTDTCSAPGDIERLAWWVARGNRLAVRLSFAAAGTLDGDGAHVLAQSYGAIIKQDPAAFLTLARDEGASAAVIAVDAVTTPDGLNGDGAAEVDELTARRDALQGVTDPALADLRDQCVAGITARLADMAPQIAAAGM
jgi:hypothetical protein